MQVSRDYIDTSSILEFDNPFIKLPVESYLSLLGITAIEPQIALINAINDPRHRFVVAALSRRTGKTFIANVLAQLVLLIPGSNVLIMSPNYGLSNISWGEQKKLLKQFDIEVTKSNEKDKVMELQNGSVLRIGSVSQADSVVGRSYDLILFDECALDDKGADAFNIQLRPTLDKPNSKAIFISTPRGRNYFHTFYQRGFSEEFPMWASIHSIWEDNPRASEVDVLEAKKSMSKAEFLQEYHCNFTVKQNTVWDFEHVHVIDYLPEDVKKMIEAGEMDVIAGIDIGFKDPTTMCVFVTDFDNVYLVDEYELAKNNTKDQAVEMQKLMDKWDIDFIYIDSAAAQTRYDLASLYDISTIKAIKSREDGANYVSSLIDNDRLYVLSSCSVSLAALENFAWDDRPGLIKEKFKHDDFSHMADAIRYALYSYSANLT